MKLVNPTDYELLEALGEHGRNTGQNLAHLLEKDRSYVNTRLTRLASAGLLDRIGPAPDSGLYELSERGSRIVEYWNTEGPYNGNHQDLLQQRQL